MIGLFRLLLFIFLGIFFGLCILVIGISNAGDYPILSELTIPLAVIIGILTMLLGLKYGGE